MFVAQAYAQTNVSPLTQIGIGDVSSLAMPTQFGMGGVGISNGDIRFVNILNPALLTYNTVYSYSAGVYGSSVTLSDKINSQRSVLASFSHFIMSFPIKPGKWTAAISLRPYSTVDYKHSVQTEVSGFPGQTYSNNVEGSGGINKVMFSNGIKIIPDLSIGINASYLFGAIVKEQAASQISDTTVVVFYSPASKRKQTFADFAFGAGASYSYKLKDKLRLNVGVTYDLKTDVKTRRLESWETRYQETPINSDSLSNGLEKGVTTIPTAFGVGVSLVKVLNWSVALDMKTQDWSNFSDFQGSNHGMGKSMFLGLGGEITPDAGDINSYLSRVTYRLGVAYESMAYQLNNNNVKDFGINFGFSLPVGSLSSADLGFKYGRRGNIDKIGHREEYFKFQVGMTFNDSMWFRKRKFD